MLNDIEKKYMENTLKFENLDKSGLSIDEINALYKEYTGLDYYFPFNIYSDGSTESPFSHFSKEYEALYKKMYDEGTLPGYCNEGKYWR